MFSKKQTCLSALTYLGKNVQIPSTYLPLHGILPIPGITYFSKYVTSGVFLYFCGASTPIRGHGLSLRGLEITFRHIVLGRTPLDEESARSRDLYLTIKNMHKRKTIHVPAGFEPAIPASQRPQIYVLDQCFSIFVRPRPGKFFLYKTRARSLQIYS